MRFRQALEKFEDGITLPRAVQIAAALLLFEVIGFGIVFGKYLMTTGVPPLGHDFAAFWSAAQLAAQGRAVDSFNGEVMHAIQASVAPVTGTLYWHYPPTFHLLILPLGGVGYRLGFVLFSVLGMAVWTFVVAQVARDVPLWRKTPVLAAPIVWSTFIQGQNGTFVALFLVMFLLALERERWAQAGFWAALLLVKPHFGVLLPLVLVLRGAWRVFPWGVVFGLVFCGLATAAFGMDYWRAFLGNSGLLWQAMLTGELSEQQISAFAFVQNMGWPYGYGMLLQIATACAAAALTAVVCRSRHADRGLRIATVLVCSLMISPYAFYYDAPISAIALFLLFRDGQKNGFALGERSIYLFFWMAPVLHLILVERYGIFVLYPAFLMLMWQCYRRFRISGPAKKSRQTAHALP